MSSISDAVIGGVLTAAVLLGLAIVAWSVSYRGRTRYSATRGGYELSAIAAIATKPGDTLVLSYPGHLTEIQRGLIDAQMSAALPIGVKVAILEGGLSLASVVVDRE